MAEAGAGRHGGALGKRDWLLMRQAFSGERRAGRWSRSVDSGGPSGYADRVAPRNSGAGELGVSAPRGA
jgi:hypothetical protein